MNSIDLAIVFELLDNLFHGFSFFHDSFLLYSCVNFLYGHCTYCS